VQLKACLPKRVQMSWHTGASTTFASGYTAKMRPTMRSRSSPSDRPSLIASGRNGDTIEMRLLAKNEYSSTRPSSGRFCRANSPAGRPARGWVLDSLCSR
jgi:hypothetical protein